MQERLAAQQQEAQAVAAAKEGLRAKLRAMEGKLIKGESQGGLLKVTERKEAEIAKREKELARRWAFPPPPPPPPRPCMLSSCVRYNAIAQVELADAMRLLFVEMLLYKGLWSCVGARTSSCTTAHLMGLQARGGGGCSGSHC